MADNPEVSQLIPINLATVCIESFLYGIFFVLYASSTYLLVRQGRAKAAAEHGSANSVYRAPMFIAAQIVFLTVTGHWVLTVYRLFQAFVNFRGGTAPLLYYANIALATEVAKSALLVATVLASDAMIIYRLYIIWGYNKGIVVLPILAWFGLIAVGAGVCWRFSQYKIGDNVYDGPIGRWVTADCFFTLATNVYCTVCISYRVFRTRFRSRKHPSLASPNLLSALAILVESAALHTAWNALFLGAFQRASTLQFTAIDVWSPVAGTAFMLINLRVALGWAQRARHVRHHRRRHRRRRADVEHGHVIVCGTEAARGAVAGAGGLGDGARARAGFGLASGGGLDGAPPALAAEDREAMCG
ncbi:hypothetical protein EVJ58_g9182 [Rhodofomes roseus]|uniref:Uncharacterized protein n=1 Tax=Rhodofomes roseus TaxID=34475 RepID=A0A4Y9XXM4_9APHY|nr:hypothetical protein EVJ58_g9182 [Rhodofomes roseus]